MAFSVAVLVIAWLLTVPLVLGMAKGIDALLRRRRAPEPEPVEARRPLETDNVVPLLPRPRNAVQAAETPQRRAA